MKIYREPIIMPLVYKKVYYIKHKRLPVIFSVAFYVYSKLIKNSKTQQYAAYQRIV
jgi:hypothetical protein